MANRPSPKPKLLTTSTNPKIPKGEGDAPVQSYIDAMPGWKRDVGRRLDEIVVGAVPKVCKAVKWNSPFYGDEPGRWFLSFHCFEKYVKVTFFDGASLDPVPPETSKYENVKYAHIREGEAIDAKLWTKWVKQASRLPGETL